MKIKLSKSKHSVGTATDDNDDQNNSSPLKATDMNLETTSLNLSSLDNDRYFPTITEDSTIVHLSYLETNTSPIPSIDLNESDSCSLDPICLNLSRMAPPTLETTDLLATNVENIILRNAQLLVERKIQDKLRDFNLEEESLSDLKKELLNDLENTIMEEVEAYRKNFFDQENNDLSVEDIYETEGFYCGGEH